MSTPGVATVRGVGRSPSALRSTARPVPSLHATCRGGPGLFRNGPPEPLEYPAVLEYRSGAEYCANAEAWLTRAALIQGQGKYVFGEPLSEALTGVRGRSKSRHGSKNGVHPARRFTKVPSRPSEPNHQELRIRPRTGAGRHERGAWIGTPALA